MVSAEGRCTMTYESRRKSSRVGETLKSLAVDATEQERRVREAVASRAFQIFKSHSSASGHELENWRQAESELVAMLRPDVARRRLMGRGLRCHFQRRHHRDLGRTPQAHNLRKAYLQWERRQHAKRTMSREPVAGDLKDRPWFRSRNPRNRRQRHAR